MATTRQVTFEAGELADKLHGRTDLALYGKGLRTCRNFYPTLEGQLVSRPGSLLVRETKGSAIAFPLAFSSANTRVRLLPFVFSGAQTYVLELGNLYMRFHTNGGTIESSPGVPLEIATPYSWASLKSLQFAQVGNIMVLTQPGYDAYQLERLSHTSWTLTPVDYSAPAWPGLPYLEPRLDPVTFKGFSGFMSEPMREDHGFTPDGDHPAREWIWGTTIDGQNTKTGRRFESMIKVVTKKYDGTDTYPAANGTVATLADHEVPLYKDMPVVISAYRQTIGTAPDYVVLGINIYRGRGGDFFGLVGRTLKGKFVDVGDEPNFAIQPPLGTNPFKVLDASGNVQRIEKPMSVAFYQDRLTFGGAYDNDKLIRVATMFFSATGQWDRFDKYKIPVATMSLEFELAVTTRQEIRTLLPMGKLLIGTDAGIHSIWGSQGVPLAADTVPDVREEAAIGCSHLRMLAIGGTAIFAEAYQADGYGSDGFAYGLAVHALQLGNGGANPLAPMATPSSTIELSAQASHLFYGDGGGSTRTLADWCYAKRPWHLVWAVRQDGVLLSLTFNEATKVAGWARHDTDGVYENVCTVPEGNEDVVYAVVRRTVDGKTRRYIERFCSRSELGGPIFGFGGISQHADDICLDSAKYYYGAPKTDFDGMGHLEGKTVWITGPSLAPLGPYTVRGGTVSVPVLGTTANVGTSLLVYIGLKYTPEMETLAVGGERERQKTLRALILEVKDTRGLRTGPALADALLKQVKQLKPTIGYAPISNQTRFIRVATMGTWDEQARAAIRQDLPLPATIVGLTREVVYGDGSP